MSIERCALEQSIAASYLSDPEKCEAWAEMYHCTPEQARDGARMMAYDWIGEEILLRLEGE